jgi:hypothetical protein
MHSISHYNDRIADIKQVFFLKIKFSQMETDSLALFIYEQCSLIVNTSMSNL